MILGGHDFNGDMRTPTILSFRAEREPALSAVEGNLLFASFFRRLFVLLESAIFEGFSP